MVAGFRAWLKISAVRGVQPECAHGKGPERRGSTLE